MEGKAAAAVVASSSRIERIVEQRNEEGRRLTVKRAQCKDCLPLILPLLLLVVVREAAAVPNLRGVAPGDERYYQTAIMKCKDGSKSFSQDRLNDDFCDCVDGTDEPGTNACPQSKFYCKNLRHRPVLLFSSRVNDGICDCCDGSDEYDGKANCPNVCRESRKQSLEKLKKKVATFKDGLTVRNRDVENAQKLLQAHEMELRQLKRDEKGLKEVVVKLKVEMEAVEKQEKEKENREREDEERRERERIAAEKSSPQSKEEVPTQAETLPESIKEGDTAAPSDSIPDGLDHLSEAERGRIIASRWTGEDVSDIVSKGETSDHLDDEDAALLHENDEGEDVNDILSNGAIPDYLSDKDASYGDDEDDAALLPENDEDDHDYDASEFLSGDKIDTAFSPASTDAAQSSWWSPLFLVSKQFLQPFHHIGKYFLQPFHRRPEIEKSEAERIRKEYQEAYDKLQSAEKKISELEQRKQQNFGKEGEFYAFYNSCFELKDKKYTYVVCPYKDATQSESHSKTRLGRWQGFTEDYKEMIFKNGDKCWNGPERSLRVRMGCGTKHVLRSVDEPSRCEYVAEFSTPALCLSSKLQALEQQLEQNDPEFVASHDEL